MTKKKNTKKCVVCKKRPVAILHVGGKPFEVNHGACNDARCVLVRMRECL